MTRRFLFQPLLRAAGLGGWSTQAGWSLSSISSTRGDGTRSTWRWLATF